MKPRSRTLAVLLILATVATAGCARPAGVRSGPTSPAPVRQTTPGLGVPGGDSTPPWNPASGGLPFESVAHAEDVSEGPDAPIGYLTERGNDASQFAHLASDEDLARVRGVDFARYLVVAAFAEKIGSSGYRFYVTKVEKTGAGLRVVATRQASGQQYGLTGFFSAYHIVKIARSDSGRVLGSTVEIVIEDRVDGST